MSARGKNNKMDMCSRGSPELLSCSIWSYELQTILMRKESRARIALGRAYRGLPYALTLFTITYTLWELLASLWRSALRRTSVRLAHCLQLPMRVRLNTVPLQCPYSALTVPLQCPYVFYHSALIFPLEKGKTSTTVFLLYRKYKGTVVKRIRAL